MGILLTSQCYYLQNQVWTQWKWGIISYISIVQFQEVESEISIKNTPVVEPCQPPAPVVKAKASSVLMNSLIISKTCVFLRRKKKAKSCNAFAALCASWIILENFWSRADPGEHAELWEESRAHRQRLYTTQRPCCWRNPLPSHGSVTTGQCIIHVQNKTQLFVYLVLLSKSYALTSCRNCTCKMLTTRRRNSHHLHSQHHQELLSHPPNRNAGIHPICLIWQRCLFVKNIWLRLCFCQELVQQPGLSDVPHRLRAQLQL